MAAALFRPQSFESIKKEVTVFLYKRETLNFSKSSNKKKNLMKYQQLTPFIVFMRPCV